MGESSSKNYVDQYFEFATSETTDGLGTHLHKQFQKAMLQILILKE